MMLGSRRPTTSQPATAISSPSIGLIGFSLVSLIHKRGELFADQLSFARLSSPDAPKSLTLIHAAPVVAWLEMASANTSAGSIHNGGATSGAVLAFEGTSGCVMPMARRLAAAAL